jgi:hypothetical protein
MPLMGSDSGMRKCNVLQEEKYGLDAVEFTNLNLVKEEIRDWFPPYFMYSSLRYVQYLLKRQGGGGVLAEEYALRAGGQRGYSSILLWVYTSTSSEI